VSRNDFIALGKQTAFGTKNITAGYFPPVESANAAPSREEMTTEETTGNRYPTALDYGVMGWDVTANGPLRAASAPRLFAGFWGLPTTTTPDATNAPTARKHSWDTVALGTALSPTSIYVVRKDPNPAVVDLFWDCYGSELTLAVEPNGYLTWDATWKARDLDDTQSAPSPTPDLTTRWPFHQVVVQLGIDGGALANVTSSGIEFTYTNNIDDDYGVLGSQRNASLGVHNADAEWTLKIKDATALSAHYRRNLQNSPAALKLHVTATGAKIGAGPSTTFYTVDFTVQLANSTEAPLEVSAGDRLKEIEIKARAAYDGTAAKFVDAFVINEVATAY
jgi:hypothetical protein